MVTGFTVRNMTNTQADTNGPAWLFSRTNLAGQVELTTYHGNYNHAEGVDMLRDTLEMGNRACITLWACCPRCLASLDACVCKRAPFMGRQ